MAGRSNLGPNSVDTEQLFDGCVTTGKIAADGVETANIKDDNVTSDKLAPGVLTQYVRNIVKTVALDKTAGTIPICTVPAGAYVYAVITSARIQFDGNITIDIGDSGDHDGFLANANVTKTLNAISGEDPATYGVYLWVPGAYTGGSLSAGSQTKTAASLTGANSDFGFDGDGHKTSGSNSTLSLASGGDWTVTQGTLTAAAITTWGHPRVKYYAADTIVNAYVAQTTTTVGMLDVYVHYTRTVMAD